MPTWYKVTPWYARLYGMILNGRPLTGYHTYQFFIPFMMLHSHFVMFEHWSLSDELTAISLYMTVMALWDYLWFVLNPWYGIRNFSAKNVWWHAKSKWLLNLPLDYYIAWIGSIGLAYLASHLSANPTIWQHHLIMLASFIVLTLLTMAAAPLFKKWYWTMRQKDERHLAIPKNWDKIYSAKPPKATPRIK